MFKMVPSFEADDFHVFEEPDVGSLFDAADEISGHRVVQPRTSHEQVDLLCALRKEHGRPPDASVSNTNTSNPTEAPYTAAARPAGPAPTITTSCICVRSTASLKPRQLAISEFVGLRKTVSPRQITTGISVTSI